MGKRIEIATPSRRMSIAPLKAIPTTTPQSQQDSPRQERRRQWWRRGRWIATIGIPLLVLSALSYGGIKLKPFLTLFTEEIPISILARFANGSPLSGTLEAYNQIPQIEVLRPLLLAPVYNHPDSIPALVNSPEGQLLLARLSRLLQTHDRQSNPQVLQAALTRAALQKDLSLINVLRQFPEAKIRISGREVWQTAWAIVQAVYQNRTAVQQLQHQFTKQQNGVQLQPQAALLHPRDPVDGFTVLLEDEARQRTLLLDVYQPLKPSEEPTPVVLISHGLTASRRTFSYLARYLASQGFFVVAVEHPDSNGRAHRRFLRGESPSLFPPQTLVDRPLDIRYVLDRLEEANLNQWLDLNHVGIIGHSLGGNTALAVAGAKLNRPALQERCEQATHSLNLSLIFAQCPLLDLPETLLQSNLRDERIRAVMAISPVASELFEPASLEQLDLPVLMVASDQDWITPAVDEQIQPFEHMTPAPSPMAVSRRAAGLARPNPNDGGGLSLKGSRLQPTHHPNSGDQASNPINRPTNPQAAPRYLAVLQGGAHWTTMGGKRCLLTGPRIQPEPSLLEQLTLGAMADPLERTEWTEIRQKRKREVQAIARDYLCGFSTAFFKTHLEGEALADYLSADYAATLSQPELPLIWVDSLAR